MTADELDRITADILREVEAGRRPDAATWTGRFPDHATAIAEFFADLGRFGSFLGLEPKADPDATVAYGPPDPLPADARRFGGYEILDEVGRGAMGVVYRARPAGTNLGVALKQVEARGLNSAEAVRRFREEVENATGLRHPHIVPIYHVGEQDGRPFYTMELIGGGSLDRLIPRFQDDPRAAAALVAKVARAVHHAHQR